MAGKGARSGIQSIDDFWVEGADEAWVEEGWLYQNADPDDAVGLVHSTAWLKRLLPCNVAIAVRAEVLGSSVGANNINLFLAYSDPSGSPLPESRAARRDGAYARYHDLNGYIFTFLRDFRGLAPGRADRIPKARYRFRRCPGFKLKGERFGERCEAGITYDLLICKENGRLTFSVDGKTRLAWTDPQPYGAGYFGFRTFRTFLRWSELEIREL